jgi:hypothetical protein
MYQVNFISITNGIDKAKTWTSNQRFNSVEEAERFAESWNLSYYSIEEVTAWNI